MTARTHRPRVLIITYLALAALLVLGSVAFWIGLPGDIRALFNAGQIGTLVVLVAFVLLLFGILAASSVRVDEGGLRIRNGLRVHRLAWPEIERVVLREQDTYATVVLRQRDADGEPVRRAMLGLQSVDRARTVRAVRRLGDELGRRHADRPRDETPD